MTEVDVFNTQVATCISTCFWLADQGQVLSVCTWPHQPMSLGLISAHELRGKNGVKTPVFTSYPYAGDWCQSYVKRKVCKFIDVVLRSTWWTTIEKTTRLKTMMPSHCFLTRELMWSLPLPSTAAVLEPSQTSSRNFVSFSELEMRSTFLVLYNFKLIFSQLFRLWTVYIHQKSELSKYLVIWFLFIIVFCLIRKTVHVHDRKTKTADKQENRRTCALPSRDTAAS